MESVIIVPVIRKNKKKEIIGGQDSIIKIGKEFHLSKVMLEALFYIVYFKVFSLKNLRFIHGGFRISELREIKSSIIRILFSKCKNQIFDLQLYGG